MKEEYFFWNDLRARVLGRSGEPFPDGIEIYALPYALEILDDTNVDTELWALLRWIMSATNGASSTWTQLGGSIT